MREERGTVLRKQCSGCSTRHIHRNVLVCTFTVPKFAHLGIVQKLHSQPLCVHIHIHTTFSVCIPAFRESHPSRLPDAVRGTQGTPNTERDGTGLNGTKQNGTEQHRTTQNVCDHKSAQSSHHRQATATVQRPGAVGPRVPGTTGKEHGTGNIERWNGGEHNTPLMHHR